MTGTSIYLGSAIVPGSGTSFAVRDEGTSLATLTSPNVYEEGSFVRTLPTPFTVLDEGTSIHTVP